MSQALREPASGIAAGAGTIDLEFGAPSLNQVWTGSVVVNTDDAGVAWSVLIGGTTWGTFQGGGPYGPLQARANERVQLFGTGATAGQNIAATFIGSLDPDDGSTPYVGPSSAVTTAASVTPVQIVGPATPVIPVSGGNVLNLSLGFSVSSILFVSGGAVDIWSALLTRTSGTGQATVQTGGGNVIVATGEDTDSVTPAFPRGWPLLGATDVEAVVSGSGTWVLSITYSGDDT